MFFPTRHLRSVAAKSQFKTANNLKNNRFQKNEFAITSINETNWPYIKVIFGPIGCLSFRLLCLSPAKSVIFTESRRPLQWMVPIHRTI